MSVRLKILLGAGLLALTAGCGTATVVGDGAAAGSDPTATPVVFVHGYSGAACPGNDVTHNIWGGAYLQLSNAGWTGALLPVSYYACDTDGVDITGYGAAVPSRATATITDANPRVRYDQNTGIKQLAHDLGWFIYDTYSVNQTPVDLVGISMGGLIMRDLLYRVAQHDPSFPPYVFVPRAVTLSTPHLGYGTMASNISFCGGHFVECDQFATDSPFIANLTANGTDPQGFGGTAWTVVGSSAGCDFVPAQSALGMPDAERVDYLSPCYAHTGYLWDFDTSDDASTQIADPGSSPVTSVDAPRSLSWLVETLSAPTQWDPSGVLPEPADTVAPTVRLTRPTTRIRTTTALQVGFAGSDTRTGIGSYDVRYRKTAWNAGFGGYRYPAGWEFTAATSLTMTAGPGHEYCFSVRARDGAGNVSDWTAARCTVVPVDDRALSAVTHGWSRTSTPAAFRGTDTRTATRGAQLRLSGVHADRLALLVTTCADCGRVGVYLDGTLWRTVDTHAATTHHRVVAGLPSFAPRTTTVTLKNLAAKKLMIDGLAVAAD